MGFNNTPMFITDLLLLLLRKIFHYLARRTHRNTIGRNITGNYAASPYRYIIADGYTGKHLHTGTYPHIITHLNGLCIFQPLVALLHIQRMPCCVETARRPYKDIVAKGNGGCIEDYKIVVGIEILAQ